MADGLPKRVQGLPKAEPPEPDMCSQCGEHEVRLHCDQCGAGLCPICTAPSVVREVCETCWDPEVDGGSTDYD